MAISKAEFIDDEAILAALQQGSKRVSALEVEAIIQKAALGKGLSLDEVAVLLHVEDPELLEEIYATAISIKKQVYGNRLVLFAPLYISDYCVNNCVYCGYKRDHKFNRLRLTMDQIRAEIAILEEMGHKRIAMECGEDPVNCPIDYVLEAIETIYSVKVKNGSIRRVNVNIAATTIDDYRRLKAANIGTYILFQETFHRPTYAFMHPAGPKHNYDWHTCSFDRAMEAGIDDVGAGVLFGLYDYKYEVLAMLQHALHLEAVFGVGPHTISVPRLRPAAGVSFKNFPHLVSDADFKKLVAIIRLAVPYTGMIISTREDAAFRDELLSVGISQMSGGSCTGVGGYCSEKQAEEGQLPQFKVADERSLDGVVASICRSGYLPSFCTACYRKGRTGDHFMPLAKSGEIQNMCQPNAIMTFKEFLIDYASPQTREIGERVIQDYLKQIPSAEMQKQTRERLVHIEVEGKRDYCF
jgi:2-iminoacetate synthase